MPDTVALSGALAEVRAARLMAEKMVAYSECRQGHEQEARAGAAIMRGLEAAEGAMKAAGIEPGEAGAAHSDLDLSELAALEAGRQEAALLAQKLAELLPLAEKLDQVRGRSVKASIPLGPDEVAGNDTADILNDLRLRLLSESGAAPGKGWE